jgi:glycosyltransferase involved in cell wall biosynthesis
MYRGATLCDGPSLNKCLNCAAHHYGRAKGISTLLANRAMGIAERRAVDMFLPVSWAVATGNNLISHQLPFQVMPNFVPDGVGKSGCPPTRRPPELPDGNYLLYVGDLTRDKGIDVLLRAYADLPDAPPLILIGRPCSDIPVEFPQNVTVLQNWAHDDVMEAWRHSTLGLVPSLCPDACPTVVMEAMASGRSIVGSRIGGITDLIADGETGMLVPPGDVSALRNAIAQLLRDPILRDRMGRAAQRRVAQFQASAIVSRIEQVYKEQCDADVVARKAAPVAQR